MIDMIKVGLSRLEAQGLDWGPIHADATLDNLHVTADGQIVLYDFEEGPGWRAADLQGWAFHGQEHQEKWNAFQQGYQEVRPLRSADLEAAPYLTLVWDIWGIPVDLDRRVLHQGHEQVKIYLDEQLNNIKARLQQFGWL
ncbi:MAG: hypothetical protein J2P37_32710 [Ktedonobacteraceae bacterium]|nr:hypothetical protein [Ktedonobacteraceae bacterium]